MKWLSKLLIVFEQFYLYFKLNAKAQALSPKKAITYDHSMRHELKDPRYISETNS